MQGVVNFSKMNPFRVLIYYSCNFTDEKIRSGKFKFKLSFKLPEIVTEQSFLNASPVLIPLALDSISEHSEMWKQ